MCNVLIIFLFISFILLKYIWINKLHIICSSFMSKCIYHPVNKSSIRYKYRRCYVWMTRLFSFREDLLCPLRGRKRRMDGHVQHSGGRQADLCELKDCLVYRESSNTGSKDIKKPYLKKILILISSLRILYYVF